MSWNNTIFCFFFFPLRELVKWHNEHESIYCNVDNNFNNSNPGAKSMWQKPTNHKLDQTRTPQKPIPATRSCWTTWSFCWCTSNRTFRRAFRREIPWRPPGRWVQESRFCPTSSSRLRFWSEWRWSRPTSCLERETTTILTSPSPGRRKETRTKLSFCCSY